MIPINNNGKNEIYNTQINKYKIILNEIKHFIYYPISLHMIKNDSYVNYFFNNDWNINNNNKKIGNKKSAYITELQSINIKELLPKLFETFFSVPKIDYLISLMKFYETNSDENISTVIIQ